MVKGCFVIDIHAIEKQYHSLAFFWRAHLLANRQY
jgi:hypothetical protein